MKEYTVSVSCQEYNMHGDKRLPNYNQLKLISIISMSKAELYNGDSYPQAWQTTSDWRLPVNMWSMIQSQDLFVEISLLPKINASVKRHQSDGIEKITSGMAMQYIKGWNEKFMRILLFVAC